MVVKQSTLRLASKLHSALPDTKLSEHHGLALVGSWAREEADSASDVDILFIGFSQSDDTLVQEILLQLTEVAPGRIDAIKAERLPKKVLESQLAEAIHFWPEEVH